MITAPEYLRNELTAKLRAGVPFDAAWEQATWKTCASGSPEEIWWRREFEKERDTWRRAYEGEAALPRDVGVGLLKGLWAAMEAGEPLDEEPAVIPRRVCAHCRGERGSMDGRPADARYCDKECRRKAERAKANR